MMLAKVQIVLGMFAAITGNDIRNSEAFQLKDAADYEVKRDLLETSYPVWKSFRGGMHSGIIPAALSGDEKSSSSSGSDDYSSYFFVLFQPDVESSDSGFRDDTLLVWLNGGPGCSSMVGSIGELGPVGTPKFRPGMSAPNPLTAADAPLVENQYAWTKKSAVLFVEQPGGVGFSKASSEWTGQAANDRDEDDVASAFYAFLTNFYNVFGEEIAKKKLYITGESYAGMYIPSIARGIHLRNKQILSHDDGGRHRSPSLHNMINLHGAAIGNGWIDAMLQVPAFIDYAFWHGMIDLQSYRGLHEKWDQCKAGQILDSSEDPFVPFTTMGVCGIDVATISASGGNFMYEVTTHDAYPDVFDDDGTIHRFFNDPVVRESLNAPSISDHPTWDACVPGAGRRHLDVALLKNRELYLDNDKPLSVVPYIAELLDDAKIDMLFYNGDLDMICNAQGTELALESMDWSGKDDWVNQNSKWKQWTVDDQPAGHSKEFGNLQFLVVYNSGHFVPINQAKNALDMISRLVDGKSFGDKELPVFPMQEKKETSQEPQIIVPTGNHHHHHLLLMGLFCFLLGMVTSHFISKGSASHRFSSSSSFCQATEATPLHHSGA